MASDVAKPIRLLVLNDFTDELRTALGKPSKRIVDVDYGEHDAKISESIHWCPTMVGYHVWREESGQFESAVAVWSTHHGNLHTHVGQPGDAICPISLDRGASLELKTKLGEELDGGVNILDHDADVVHTLDRHLSPGVKGHPADTNALRLV